MKKIPRILISPLDWGLGHATRCVPVIRELQKRRASIILGAGGRASNFLSGYFPEIQVINIPGPRVQYPTSGSMACKMAVQAPAILSGIRREHLLLKKIIPDFKIDAVISDNRFGLWSKEAYSVYITHQLRIKSPKGWHFTDFALSEIHRQFIRNFDECWIPDYPGENNLSGELGHPSLIPSNYNYIGPLSRFNLKMGNAEPAIENAGPDILCLVSGPEPQRSIFERIMLEELSKNPERQAVILRGLPGEGDDIPALPHVSIHSHMPDDEMTSLIKSAKLVICRPGYSTLMDLASLGKGAILVPTPGQTEQEYLAKYHSGNPSFITIRQSEFDLNKALDEGSKLKLQGSEKSGQELLSSRIDRFLDSL